MKILAEKIFEGKIKITAKQYFYAPEKLNFQNDTNHNFRINLFCLKIIILTCEVV